MLRQRSGLRPPRTAIDLVDELNRLARSQQFGASSFKAIGALSYVRLGWFNWETRQYDISIELAEQVELLLLIGDIALKGNSPQVHAHATVARRDGSAYGGHLLKAIVRLPAN
jgi:uncharacterized protein